MQQITPKDFDNHSDWIVLDGSISIIQALCDPCGRGSYTPQAFLETKVRERTAGGGHEFAARVSCFECDRAVAFAGPIHNQREVVKTAYVIYCGQLGQAAGG